MEVKCALKPGRQGANLAKIRRKNSPGQGRNKCKDPEMGMTLAPSGAEACTGSDRLGLF